MRLRLTVLALLALPAVLAAQVKYPDPPAKYHVDLRYKLPGDANQRVRDYREMTAALDKLGFVPAAREDADLDQYDATAERLSGTLPSKDAAKLADVPGVQTFILRPEGSELPDDARKFAQLRIRITSGLRPTEQRLFHEQVAAQLARLGFQEQTGYDNDNSTLVRGAMPAGRVPELLRDLRDQPSGWFFSDIPRDQLNLPLRDVLPVRRVDVLPDVDFGPAAAPTPPLPEAIASPRYAADLRAYLADPTNAGKPLRVELVLTGELPEGARGLRQYLRLRVPAAAMEGVYGNFAVIQVPTAGDLVKLADVPGLLSIRLPRLAAEQPGAAKTNVSVDAALTAGNVPALNAAGYRGRGVRVIVLATDFGGADKLLGTKLPKTVDYLDLTAELSPAIEPTPPGSGVSGTETAAAIHAAAPAAELVLVRVHPVAIHQLLTVTKTVLGSLSASVAVQTRGDELSAEAETLNIRRDIVADEYRLAFNDLTDDEKPTKRRAAAAAAFKKLQADQQAYKEKSDRLTSLRTKLTGLIGANVVVNTLVWEDGYAHDGLSEVSRLLDVRLAPQPARSGLRALKQPTAPVWVQAGSTSLGSVWTGPFLDADGNGVLEFGPPAGKRPAGTWTPELNFLTLIGPDGKAADTLPAGVRVRISIQWREPRDPDTDLTGQAAFPIKLKLLRQIDPAGEKAASDDFAVVAQANAPPVHVQHNFTAGVYEQVLEATLPAAGRYALRVEGGLSRASLAGTHRASFELRPRIYAAVTDSVKGRLAFTTYTPQAAGVAIPGDSTTAITVGIENGLVGAGPGMVLRVKPDVFAQDVVSPASATGAVAGVVACLVEAGVHSTSVSRLLTPRPGSWLTVPAEWIRSLPRKADSR